MNLDFYSGKRVFVTGHTGFKGAWLSKILLTAGADVITAKLDGVEKTCILTVNEDSKKKKSKK